jgi:hypothetical protein
MLTIEQIDALLKEGLHVFQGTGRQYRTVWREDGAGFADKQSRLMSAHPSDEAGNDWQVVTADENGMTTCRVAFEESTGVFQVLRDFGAKYTKVVKFAPPVPPENGMKPLHDYVVFLRSVPISDEDACETAIDILIGMNRDPMTLQPLLVI